MASINGGYEFHRSCASQELWIFGYDGSGALESGSIDGEAIQGHYDPSNNRITFNDARQPGDTLFVSFYTGYVMPTEAGGTCAMAGTFTEQELLLEENPGWVFVHPLTFHGAWYAIWREEYPA